MTMGSWCTSFPLKEWSPSDYTSFVNYFKELRENTFGGSLDGIDFDWEGFCPEVCLKTKCSCSWSDKMCGDKSPEELAAGVRFMVDDYSPTSKGPKENMCFIFPTETTMKVMTGITREMKKEGFVVTLVPMSTSVYTSK